MWIISYNFLITLMNIDTLLFVSVRHAICAATPNAANPQGEV